MRTFVGVAWTAFACVGALCSCTSRTPSPPRQAAHEAEPPRAAIEEPSTSGAPDDVSSPNTVEARIIESGPIGSGKCTQQSYRVQPTQASAEPYWVHFERCGVQEGEMFDNLALGDSYRFTLRYGTSPNFKGPMIVGAERLEQTGPPDEQSAPVLQCLPVVLCGCFRGCTAVSGPANEGDIVEGLAGATCDTDHDVQTLTFQGETTKVLQPVAPTAHVCARVCRARPPRPDQCTGRCGSGCRPQGAPLFTPERPPTAP